MQRHGGEGQGRADETGMIDADPRERIAQRCMWAGREAAISDLQMAAAIVSQPMQIDGLTDSQNSFKDGTIQKAIRGRVIKDLAKRFEDLFK